MNSTVYVTASDWYPHVWSEGLAEDEKVGQQPRELVEKRYRSEPLNVLFDEPATVVW